jgi:hypothetical protein
MEKGAHPSESKRKNTPILMTRKKSKGQSHV